MRLILSQCQNRTNMLKKYVYIYIYIPQQQTNEDILPLVIGKCNELLRYPLHTSLNIYHQKIYRSKYLTEV